MDKITCTNLGDLKKSPGFQASLDMFGPKSFLFGLFREPHEIASIPVVYSDGEEAVYTENPTAVLDRLNNNALWVAYQGTPIFEVVE